MSHSHVCAQIAKKQHEAAERAVQGAHKLNELAKTAFLKAQREQEEANQAAQDAQLEAEVAEAHRITTNNRLAEAQQRSQEQLKALEPEIKATEAELATLHATLHAAIDKHDGLRKIPGLKAALGLVEDRRRFDLLEFLLDPTVLGTVAAVTVTTMFVVRGR
jgi:hypothetical protein